MPAITVNEKCKVCYIGEMVHPALYIWTCTHCGYSYKIDPNVPWNESGITILNRGKKQ